MKNAIILHGNGDQEEYYSSKYPSASNSHWIPWLQKQLLINDFAAHTPEMPNSHTPDYSVWCKEFERYELSEETLLVGHSSGAVFLVRWLSEHPDVMVGKVVLVAFWLDPFKEESTDFFDFEIDSSLIDRTSGITIFESDNDHVAGVAPSIELITGKIPRIKLVTLKNHGHFTLLSMGTDEFPELLTEILN
jgi:predicted alpha/beta hydrolase family esterase